MVLGETDHSTALFCYVQGGADDHPNGAAYCPIQAAG